MRLGRITALIPISLAAILQACLPGGEFFEQETTDEILSENVVVELSGERTIAKVSASATVTQNLTAPNGSSISGTELQIPPGTLQIDMSITLEESSALASSTAAGAMGVSFGSEAGKAVNLSNDQGILELPESAPPMTLRIPYNTNSLSLQTDGEDVLVTFMRQALASGDCIERVYPPSTFSLIDKKIQIEVRSFAAYQPIYIPSVELERALNASSYDYIEAIRPGCRIVTKTEEKSQPQLSLQNFRSTLEGRELSLQADFKTDASDITLLSCTLFGKDLDLAEVYTMEAKQAYFVIDFSQRWTAFQGRFAMSCETDSSQTVESNFLSVNLDPQLFPLDVVYESNRQVSFEASLDLKNMNSCIGTATDTKGQIETLAITSKTTKVDFSDTQEALAFDFQISCELDNGLHIYSETVSVTLDEQPPPSPPTNNNTTVPDIDGPIATSVSWSQSNYIPGDTLSLELSIFDDSNLSSICLLIDSMNYKPLDLGCLTPNLSAGLYSVSTTVPSFIDNTTYGILELILVDEFGNHRSYQGSPGNPNFIDTDLANPSFAVSGATPDLTAPTVSNLSVSSNTAILPDTITLSFVAMDSDSTVAKNREHCFELEGKTSYKTHKVCDILTDMGADSYQVSLNFPTYLSNEDYYLKNFSVYDRAGNEASFSASNIDTIYPSTSIPVPVITTSSGLPDVNPPYADELYFGADSYQVGDYASLFLILNDTGGAGVSEIISSCWNLYEGNYGPTIAVCGHLRYLGQDLYVMDFYIPLAQTPGTYYLYGFNVQDKAGNNQYYSPNAAPPSAYVEDTALLAPSFTLTN